MYWGGLGEAGLANSQTREVNRTRCGIYKMIACGKETIGRWRIQAHPLKIPFQHQLLPFDGM